MTRRSVVTLLLAVSSLVSLSGCVADEPADPAPSGDDYEVITDPTNLTYNGTSGFHVHDYWGGQDRLVVLDQARGTFWNTIGTGTWTVAFFPNDGDFVPQGTSELEFTVDWNDGLPTDAYGAVSLWVKGPLDHEPRLVRAVTQGDSLTLPITYDEADLPHQTLSAWEFQVRFNTTTDRPYSFFSGTATVTAEAVRGYDLQPFPPHPDHWNGTTERALVDHEQSYFWNSYTGTGQVPVRIRALDDALVPPGAQVVTATLTADNDLPVGGLRLAVHGADTRNWTYLEPESVEGNQMHYWIDIERGMPDGPYANESLWEFLVNVESTTPPGQAVFQGSFKLEATVHKQAPL